MNRCEEDSYASDNTLRGTPRGSRKKPNVGKYPTSHLSTDVLCRGFEKNGMVRAGYGRSMASVNQTRLHCVNQMGKTHSKPFAHGMTGERHGRGMGTECYVWIGFEASALLQNVGILLSTDAATYPRRTGTSATPLLEISFCSASRGEGS